VRRLRARMSRLTRDRCEVAIVGSGFAGSLLARILARLGYATVLLERNRHPRFALGESTTPLANLCLERLSRRYGLPDAYDLSAHGRWLRRFPSLRRGLKRGFTFYGHRSGVPYANDGDNSARLLVAASPSADVADTHWLREDVDHHFVREAVAAGVDYRDGAELEDVEVDRHGARLLGKRDGRPFALRADMLVDGSGAGGFLARRLPIPSALRRTTTRSALVYGHFRGARLFADVAREQGVSLPAGPYPDDLAAVHHCFPKGWMYVLRFDDGVVSAGFLLPSFDGRRTRTPSAGELWRRLLSRHPSIAAQFADARPLFPIGFQPRVQHRLARAVGERWVLLPHTFAFVDPLFSTGIAWSLIAVERLALAFECAAERRSRRVPDRTVLSRYESYLSREADQIDALVSGAYLALADFNLFVSHAMLYFAAVSFAEARQRLRADDSTPWEGFLGVDDPLVAPLFRRSTAKIRGATRGGRRSAAAGDRSGFADWISERIAPRNVADLANPERRNLYPVDLEVLEGRCGLLGLTAGEFRDARSRLRGTAGQAG
jgi:tetracycline 7-halogenase / FADH2 O2-dependent halogenase